MRRVRAATSVLRKSCEPPVARPAFLGWRHGPDLRPRAPVPGRGAGAGRPAARASPSRSRVIVVDNGSRDDTAEVARRLGATRGAPSPCPGTAPRCTPGWWPPTREYVAVMDGDGSFDPRRAAPAARRGPLGPRRPGRRPPPPGRARRLAVARPARQRPGRLAGCAAGSAWPCTTSPRCGSAAAQALLDLDVRDRRFGYPVELLQKATARRLAARRARRRPTTRAPPAPAPRCPARSRGTVAHRPRLRRVLRMTTRACWWSPRPRSPARSKTRLGAEIGMATAAELAAAALLDTLDACARGVRRRRAAGSSLSGDLARRRARRRADPRRVRRLDRRSRSAARTSPSGSPTPTSTPAPRRAGRPDRHGHPAGHRRRPAPRSPTRLERPRRRPRRRPRTAAGGCSACARPDARRGAARRTHVDADDRTTTPGAPWTAAGLAVGTTTDAARRRHRRGRRRGRRRGARTAGSPAAWRPASDRDDASVLRHRRPRTRCGAPVRGRRPRRRAAAAARADWARPADDRDRGLLDALRRRRPSTSAAARAG